MGIGVTPFKSCSSQKLTIKHFRLLDTQAWVHIHTERCKAMDPQIQPYIFVVYLDGVKGY
jgi:hypothetical protein